MLVVRSRGIAFVTEEVAQAILDIIPDGVAAPISEFVGRTYSLLLTLASRAFGCTSDWLQASFTS